MVTIKNYELGGFYIETDNDEHILLFNSAPAYLTIGEAWHYITQVMYQLGSTCCFVENQTEQPHAIYRLYEDGTKEKLPIKVRNSESNTVKNND